MSESVKITDALRQRILDKVMTTPIPSDVNLFEFVALNAAREMAILIRERYRVQHMPTCPVGADKLECPTCGGLLGMVRQGANSMLNSYQFDAVKAGDYYCTACKGGEAQGSTYKYWWKSDLAKHPCTCGLDDLLASLDSGDAPVPQQEKEEKAFSAELIHQTIPDVVETEPRLGQLQKIAIEAHHEMDGSTACAGAECPRVKQLIQFAYDAWDLIAEEAVSHLNQPHTCHGNEHMPPGPCLACQSEKATEAT